MNWNDPRLSRIIELELEVTRAVILGHKPGQNDEFEEKRKELKRLREETGIDKLVKRIQGTK